YISDAGNARIRKVDASTGVITTVAGTGVAGFSGDGGAATSAKINDPHGITFDGSGDLIFADSANNRVRQIDPFGTITTIAGTGVAGSGGDGGDGTLAQLNDP